MHGGLGAGPGEADALAAGDRLAQQTRQLGAQLVLVGAGGAVSQDLLDGPADVRVAVTQKRGTVAAA